MVVDNKKTTREYSEDRCEAGNACPPWRRLLLTSGAGCLTLKKRYRVLFGFWLGCADTDVVKGIRITAGYSGLEQIALIHRGCADSQFFTLDFIAHALKYGWQSSIWNPAFEHTLETDNPS